MAKRISAEHQRELEELHGILIVVAQHLDELVPLPGHSFVSVIERAAAEGDLRLRGLRMVRNDFMTGALAAYSGVQRLELDRRLRDQVGMSLEHFEQKQSGRIANVVRRGKIRNDTEYYLLRERLESVWNDVLKGTEVNTLKEMLAAYESRLQGELNGTKAQTHRD